MLGARALTLRIQNQFTKENDQDKEFVPKFLSLRLEVAMRVGSLRFIIIDLFYVFCTIILALNTN